MVEAIQKSGENVKLHEKKNGYPKPGTQGEAMAHPRLEDTNL